MKSSDLSGNGLFTMKQVIEITGIGHTTVAKYALLFNVKKIGNVRYFNQLEIDKLKSYCKSRKPKDIIGRRVNYLTAIKCVGKIGHSYLWEWRCDCGKIITVTLHEMNSKKLQSCGCKSTEIKKKQIKGARSNIIRYDNTAINKLKRTSRGILNKNNKTGINGVRITHIRGKKYYRASIGIKSKDIFIGLFKTLDEARRARELAENKYHDPIIQEYQSMKKIRGDIKKELKPEPVIFSHYLK